MVNAGDAAAIVDNVVVFPAAAQSKRENDVERVNHYPLYEVGKTFRRMIDALEPEEIQTRRLYTPFRSALAALDGLLAGNPFPLGISKTAASELRADIQREFNNEFTHIDATGKTSIRLPDNEK